MPQRDSNLQGAPSFVIELRTLLLLGLAWGFAYWDRMSITFLGPMIEKELHLTHFELSALPAALARVASGGRKWLARPDSASEPLPMGQPQTRTDTS